MQELEAKWGRLEPDAFLSKFADPRFEPVIRHWLALRQEDQIPSRRDLDPVKFRRSLDMVWLLERHEDGHFRYRLAGQKIAEIHGGIKRGSEAAILFSRKDHEMFRARWEAALEGKLVRAEGVVMRGGRPSRLERLMLPLRADDGGVSVVLGVTHYEEPRLRGQTATAFPPTDVQCCPLDALPLGASL